MNKSTVVMASVLLGAPLLFSPSTVFANDVAQPVAEISEAVTDITEVGDEDALRATFQKDGNVKVIQNIALKAFVEIP